MSIFKGISEYFLMNYNENDFLRTKKVIFITIFNFVMMFMLTTLAFIYYIFSGYERFIETMYMAIPVIFVALLSLIFVRKGKIEIASNIMALFFGLVSIGGFLIREPHLAGVSVAYFLMINVIFSVLFASRKLSLLVLLSYIGTHTYYFISTSKYSEGLLYETAKSTMVDGILTLIIIYVIGRAAEKFLTQALNRAEVGAQQNKKQLDEIKDLIGTMNDVSKTVEVSIIDTSNSVIQLSDNSRNQAATMEEISASMEEISANTHNVSQNSTTQIKTVDEFRKSIDEMSNSISAMLSFGGELTTSLEEFIKLAKTGADASKILDDTNNKISDNSNSILSIVGIMGDFFEKINLLSLNASIEAARAGEHGRGFAVVAEEIGKLSDSSATDLKKVTDLIYKNKEDAEVSSKTIVEIVKFVGKLTDSIKDVQQKAIISGKELSNQLNLKDVMDEKTSAVEEKANIINISMSEQKLAIDDIVISIEETNKGVQQNAESTDQLQLNLENMKNLAEQLTSKFHEDSE